MTFADASLTNCDCHHGNCMCNWQYRWTWILYRSTNPRRFLNPIQLVRKSEKCEPVQVGTFIWKIWKLG